MAASGAPLGSGWRVLDASLDGGWPAGEVTEILGRGRVTLALAAVRCAQAAGRPAAWIDGTRTFCPSTAGVDLERLALVRPDTASAARALLAADLLLRSRAFGLLVLDLPAGRSTLAAWFRLARQAQHGATGLLLLSPAPAAGSAAALTVRVALRRAPCASWDVPPDPALELAVLRRRGGRAPAPLRLDPAAPDPAAARAASRAGS